MSIKIKMNKNWKVGAAKENIKRAVMTKNDRFFNVLKIENIYNPSRGYLLLFFIKILPKLFGF